MTNLITHAPIKQTQVISADIKTDNQLLPLRVGTAFSGIGAFELAMANTIEHTNEFIIEWDPKAQKTFLANFSVKKVFNDITKINLDEIPSIDIYCMTPSCVDFSSAGLQKGFNGTSGKLVFDALKIIEKTLPKYVVYENVKAMVSKKFIKSFENIIKILSDLGYKTHWKVLNSHDFGLPQNRERVYLVGILDGDQTFEFPKPTTPDIKKSINDIMVPNTDYSQYIYQEKLEKFIPKRNSFIKTVYTIPRLAAYAGDSKVYSTSGISTTLRTGNRDHFYDTKNKLFRRLTLEELTALQGFSKDFKWHVGKTAQRKQLGNSVSVPVFEAILKELLVPYLPTTPTVANKVPASITNTTKSSKTTCISLLQTIKEKEGYVSGPLISTKIQAIRKTATDRTTKIIEAHIDRPLLSKNMYINQALINYSKDKNIFDSIEKMTDIKLTQYLKRDLNIYNYDSFADDSDTKKLTLFPYAGGKQGVNKSKMQSLVSDAFKQKKYTKFIDSFAGGLGATYNVLPILLENNIEEIIINDINKSIINVYRQIQRNPKQVQRQLASISLDHFKEFGKFTPESREEARVLHVKLEAEFKELELQKKMTPRRAALFLFLMHKSTGGMVDYDMKTKTCFFETSYKIINIDLLINKVQLFHKIFNSTKMTFKSVQYQTIFKTYASDATALMLIDPPYVEYNELESSTKGCSFTYGIDFDQQELLRNVKNLKCDFVYYNNHNPLIENFANKNGFYYLKNSRTFSNNSEDHTKSVEICMTKFTTNTYVSTPALNNNSANNYVENSMAA